MATTNAQTNEDAIRLAIAKAIDTKTVSALRESVEEGSDIALDAIVHLRGTLSVGHSCETTQTNKIEPLKLLLVALGKLNGVTIDMIVREAEAMKKKEFELRKMEVDHALRRLRGTVKQRRAGALKFKGTLDVVKA